MVHCGLDQGNQNQSDLKGQNSSIDAPCRYDDHLFAYIGMYLHHFHHRCARTMCRITIAHLIRHRISSASLLQRLSIEPFVAADRNQWRAVCGSKMPSATNETPTSSRQDIWAELR
jgi:hypothetical protein